MNLFIGIGRLVREPELRMTPNQTPVLSNAIAISRNKEEVDFIDFVAFDKTASLINQYCSKGDKICIRGKVQKRSYINASGATTYVTEIIAYEVEFLQDKKVETQEQNTSVTPQAFEEQDDLPF